LKKEEAGVLDEGKKRRGDPILGRAVRSPSPPCKENGNRKEGIASFDMSKTKGKDQEPIRSNLIRPGKAGGKKKLKL